MTQDRLDEAIAVLRKLERYHPDEAIVLHNLANVYEWRGLIGDALATFDHILELRPDDLEAFIAVGRLLRTHPAVVIDVFGQPNFTPLNLRNVPRQSPTAIAPDFIDDRPVLICEMEPEIVGICAEAPGWFWWQLFECSTYPILRLYVEFNYQPYKYHEFAMVLDIGKSHDQSWLRRLQENESLELWMLGRSKSIGFRRSFSFSPEQSARVGRLMARADAYLRTLSSDVRDFGTAAMDVEARR
jgi:tetratricopeptide (TPR) repeat protein